MRTRAGLESSVGRGRRRARKTAIWAAAAGLGAVAACGASTPLRAVTTANAVGNAFSGIRSQPGVSLTISLGVTPDQLLQMQKVDSGSGLTAALAGAVSGTSVVINVHTGHGESLGAASAKGSAGDKDGQAELSLLVKGTTTVDVRVVNQTLFVKADVAKLLSLYGQGPSMASAAQNGLSQLDSTVAGISKLGNGEWVSVSMQQLSSLAKSASKAGGTPAPPSLGGSFLKDISAVFNRNETIVNDGTHDGRTEYTIKAPVRQLAQDLVSTLSKDSGSSAAAMSALTSSLSTSVASIPANLRATVQLWVKDNKAQELDFDLNQFDAKYPFPVPLKVVIGGGTVVKAPAGATAIDLSPLAGMLSHTQLSGAGCTC